MSYSFRHLSAAPFSEAFASVTLASIRSDLQAGLTVAIFAVPQGMAYAMLAGVPPVYGLYAAVVMPVVAALWGSSEFVNTGPTNSAALLAATALLPFANHPEMLRILFLLTLMIGAMRFLFGVLNFGSLLDFVSESAFVGFTVGAGILIALGQVHHLLGVAGSSNPWFPARMVEVIANADGINIFPLALGLGTLAFMLALNRFSTKLPIAFVAILLATGVAAWLAGYGGSIGLVRDIAPVPMGLPKPVMPYMDIQIMWHLLPAALAISIIGLVEAVSIGQNLALKHDQSLNYNQEFVGQGLSHMVSAFFQGIPGSGSFSRSILIEQAGGVSRLANLFFGLATAVTLLTIPRLLDLIPISALSGLLLFVGYKLIDAKKIQRIITTSKMDAAVMVLTFFVTVCVKIEYGIFTGILASAVIYLDQSRQLNVHALYPGEGKSLEEKSIGQALRDDKTRGLLVLSFGSDLFYGVAQRLRQRLSEIRKNENPDIMILRMRRAYSIDYSCWSVIFDFAQTYTRQGGKLYLCGIRSDANNIIRAAGMDESLPESHLFPAEAIPFAALKKCIEAALRNAPADDPDLIAWQDYLDQPNPTRCV